ncbi:glycoside hydrolase family 75 protein [Roseateles violae]|uniref:Glycoside hydrolase family 75 protein n=1 Tax=Roseateles violae TaxID=3058042 RepID=A0ABT8DPR4_9BURK|nr:glycoside hydrolase family 75 protein [Pelomonas sp. PFR6]MDN3920003.1 glycoside hydrolase family 75 protein [Pelomonas sp. PFR6]
MLELTIVCLLLAASVPAAGQIAGACRFDVSLRRFQGTDLQQAQCLLRSVKRWGKVAAAPAVLPPALEALIGKPVGFGLEQLRTLLAASGLDESAVGGKLSAHVSARYFVIHDTSSPWLGDTSFPADDTPALNNLATYRKPDAVAHVFVSRTGQTLLGHDFSEPWRATKLESTVIGPPASGLFLHVELLQPRRRDPAGGPKNDAMAPIPGFTPVQYERLALLYAAASARAGAWLVPAMHASIDEGLVDAHDDPQNFVLADFASALERLQAALTGTVSEQPPASQASDAPVAASSAVPASEATPGSPGDLCAPIVAGLARLTGGAELLASGSGNKSWKSLFDECDRSDRFAGQALPTHAGKPLRCSTDPNRVAFISRYADGTVVFQAKASVDADGSPVVGGSGWPNDVQTWLTYDKGSKDTFVNAEEVPFIVLPLPTKAAGLSLMKDMRVGKGDLAVVVSGGRCTFGVLGDAGPWFRLGELSLRAHEEMGNPQCRIPGEHPCKGLKGGSGIGIVEGVTYIVFPGTRPKPLLSQTVNKVVRELATDRALRFLQANTRP